MKTIFENRTVYTKDYYKEYYKHIHFKSPIMIIINTILSISFIICVLSMIFPTVISIDAYEVEANIATVLILVCFQFYLYSRNKNLAYSRDLEKNNGNPIEANMFITEESVSINTSFEQDVKMKFVNIAKIIKTKNYYILVSKARLTVGLKKDGFITGTPEEFEKFLKQKGIAK